MNLFTWLSGALALATAGCASMPSNPPSPGHIGAQGIPAESAKSIPPIVTDLRAWPDRPDAAQLRIDRTELEALLRRPAP